MYLQWEFLPWLSFMLIRYKYHKFQQRDFFCWKLTFQLPYCSPHQSIACSSLHQSITKRLFGWIWGSIITGRHQHVPLTMCTCAIHVYYSHNMHFSCHRLLCEKQIVHLLYSHTLHSFSNQSFVEATILPLHCYTLFVWVYWTPVTWGITVYPFLTAYASFPDVSPWMVLEWWWRRGTRGSSCWPVLLLPAVQIC